MREVQCGDSLSWSFVGHGLETGLLVPSPFSGAIEGAAGITPGSDFTVLLLQRENRMTSIMEVPHSTPSWMLSYAVLVLTLLISITRSRIGQAKRNPPPYPEGPRTIPVLGSILSFSTIRKNPDQTLIRLARNYGALCMLWLGSKPVVIVSSPKAAKDLMDKAS